MTSAGTYATFSHRFEDFVYDKDSRKKKAKKIVAVLADYYGDLKQCQKSQLLDIGCSTGYMTQLYGKYFGSVRGIDIDIDAVEFASEHNRDDHIQYLVDDSFGSAFKSNSFDVIICNHVYEQLPDPAIMMQEIYRLLKDDGVCYFAGDNRYRFLEPHYKLPFLSMCPRSLSNFYLRMFRDHKVYNIKYLTYRGLKKLVSDFNIIDYTKKIVNHPEKFNLDGELGHSNSKEMLASLLLKVAYPLSPTYIWLLTKKKGKNRD